MGTPGLANHFPSGWRGGPCKVDQGLVEIATSCVILEEESQTLTSVPENKELRLYPFHMRCFTLSANRKSKEEYDEEMSRRLLLEEDAASSSMSAACCEQPVAEGGDGQNATSAQTRRDGAAQVRPQPGAWAIGLNTVGGASTLWNLGTFTLLKIQCAKIGLIYDFYIGYR